MFAHAAMHEHSLFISYDRLLYWPHLRRLCVFYRRRNTNVDDAAFDVHGLAHEP